MFHHAMKIVERLLSFLSDRLAGAIYYVSDLVTDTPSAIADYFSDRLANDEEWLISKLYHPLSFILGVAHIALWYILKRRGPGRGPIARATERFIIVHVLLWWWLAFSDYVVPIHDILARRSALLLILVIILIVTLDLLFRLAVRYLLCGYSPLVLFRWYRAERRLIHLHGLRGRSARSVLVSDWHKLCAQTFPKQMERSDDNKQR